MMDHRRSKFEQIIKIIKVNDDIQAGKVELPKISNDEIKKYNLEDKIIPVLADGVDKSIDDIDITCNTYSRSIFFLIWINKSSFCIKYI